MGIIKIQPKLALRPYTKDSGFVAKVINWWCHSKYYHAELILGEHWISATPKDGIYVNKLKPLDHERYEYLELPEIEVAEETYKNIWKYIEAQVSPKYDTLGLVWNQVIGISFYNKSWFCSELIAAILILLGYNKLYGTNESEYSPQDLHDMFKYPVPIELRRFSICVRFKKFIRWILKLIAFSYIKSYVVKGCLMVKSLFTKLKRKKKQ